MKLFIAENDIKLNEDQIYCSKLDGYWIIEDKIDMNTIDLFRIK